MGDLDLHYQGPLVIFGLKYQRFGGCNAITCKYIYRVCTKFAQIMHMTSLKNSLNMGDPDLHFQGHWAIFYLEILQFGGCSAIELRHSRSQARLRKEEGWAKG